MKARLPRMMMPIQCNILRTVGIYCVHDDISIIRGISSQNNKHIRFVAYGWPLFGPCPPIIKDIKGDMQAKRQSGDWRWVATLF